MVDDVDRAQTFEQTLRESAIKAHRHNHGMGREDCVDCGQQIPEARRLAVPHATRCADCQSDLEG